MRIYELRALPLLLEPIHRLFKPFHKHDFQRFCGLRKDLVQMGLLDSVKNVQHIVGRIHALGRPSNTDFQPQKVISAHPIDNGTDPLMSSIPSSSFKTKLAKGKV